MGKTEGIIQETSKQFSQQAINDWINVLYKAGITLLDLQNIHAIKTTGGDIRVTTQTPANASDTGTTGTIAWDASYIYICTATDTWKRVAIATW